VSSLQHLLHDDQCNVLTRLGVTSWFFAVADPDPDPDSPALANGVALPTIPNASGRVPTMLRKLVDETV
jgi:hypothetical protein